MRAFALRISRSNCAAQSPRNCADAWGGRFSAATSARDVCPWNRRAPATGDTAFQPLHAVPRLESLAAIGEAEFREMFRGAPISRARYSGFLRNVARVAMGNSRLERFRPALMRLAASADALVADHARWALEQLHRRELP